MSTKTTKETAARKPARKAASKPASKPASKAQDAPEATSKASKAKPAAKPAQIILSKGNRVSVDPLNALLNRLRGIAGNVKASVIEAGREDLLAYVEELTGDGHAVMNGACIKPLKDAGFIDAETATKLRALASFQRACAALAKVS